MTEFMKKYKTIIVMCLLGCIVLVSHYVILLLVCRDVSFYKRFIVVLSPYTHIAYVRLRRTIPFMIANVINIIRVKRYEANAAEGFNYWLQLHLPSLLGAAMVMWGLISMLSKLMPVISAMNASGGYESISGALLATMAIPFALTAVWLTLAVLIAKAVPDRSIDLE